MLYYIILYYTIVYYTILYYTTLHYTTLYYNILYITKYTQNIWSDFMEKYFPFKKYK